MANKAEAEEEYDTNYRKTTNMKRMKELNKQYLDSLSPLKKQNEEVVHAFEENQDELPADI
eukprot:CAMPEP_0170567844 /NCGR_PEP_ID=MMETSP0211-20121228/80747_1 /TAXON_ID=311385 /ORGANISM="Pseudokeronopsis sp., Strain OXSARD2" /LENGTH=60 /DNA_ID=CAMNT_0010889425 /DNA_START=108 /DNA_END=290 /DNA_ORIENTATION=-